MRMVTACMLEKNTPQFGYKCKNRELARGKIHGIKEEPFGVFKTHLWVECKAYTVKRTHVTKLVESARDVRDLDEESDYQKWSPNMLMLVSNKGFDIDAIGMADKHRIYCVKAGRTFEFVGKRNRENFEDKEACMRAYIICLSVNQLQPMLDKLSRDYLRFPRD